MNDIPLYPSERIDDLLTHDLRIIQSDEVFSFSLDSVLLARFCTTPPRGRIIDLCSGNGVIPLLLSTRSKLPITGVEIQPRVADMARRSVQMNRLEGQIEIVESDLRVYAYEVPPGSYDLVTVNPPYLPQSLGMKNRNEHMAIARFEIMCTMDEVVAAASRLVRNGGKVAVVHRASRLAELLASLRAHRLEPKRLRMVHPRAGTEANMVLVEAIRDANPELRVLPPLFVYEGNRYCQELLEIYYGKRAQL
jgi:tRNA1(Val) A37 N6-methylase TrmN6